jgi:hypothetical protein
VAGQSPAVVQVGRLEVRTRAVDLHPLGQTLEEDHPQQVQIPVGVPKVRESFRPEAPLPASAAADRSAVSHRDGGGRPAVDLVVVRMAPDRETFHAAAAAAA